MSWGIEASSTFAPDVDHIFSALLITSSIIVALVWVGIIYLCIKYRKGSKASRKAPPEKSLSLEALIVSVILAFGLLIFVWSAQTFYKMVQPPLGAIEVDVVAKQWMWIFHDAHGDRINVLKVPIGRPVRLVMTSEDVIHSFFVPEFRLKQDVLPGRYTTVWFEASHLGRFEILCSQYCGLRHSQMRGLIEVISAEDYENTKPHDLADSELGHGRSLFTSKGCVACHESTSGIAPSLENIYNHSVELTDGSVVIADENYLRRAILQPNADIVKGYTSTMPSFQGQLSEDDLLALIRYIKSKSDFGKTVPKQKPPQEKGQS